ncbi:hypothetical protein ZWY2020_006462 [Hordeum vulgare]|nr:hypothetical protein ZWY2020_006462 [Hordeum vulgare]
MHPPPETRRRLLVRRRAKKARSAPASTPPGSGTGSRRHGRLLLLPRGDDDDDNEPYLVGFVVAKIVGLKYYTGTLSGGERPSLIREPLNRFDSNAIAVHNSCGRHVGHIEGRTAKVLAPLLDSHLVANTLVVVPDGRSSKAGTSFYRLPCQIHLFTRPTVADIVREAIDGSGLVLIDPDHIEFSLSGSAFVQEQAKKSVRDVNKLFARVGKEGGSRIEPMEPPEDVVVSDLFEHQKAALGWLVHRRTAAESLRGGIFADDMGLGNTLTLLSLIARSKARNVGGGKAKGSKRKKIDDAEAGSRTTLVVCPPSVFSSWVTQLEEHTNAGSLKVYMYHGQRTKDKEVLLKYDTVSPVNDIEWFRVILDEAHIIKSSASLQIRAMTALKNSSLDLYLLMAFLKSEPFSVKSYWESLIHHPLEKGNKAGLSRLQNLLGAISLRRTKETECGSKSVVAIPRKTVVACYIELSAEERECYDQMESEGRNKMIEFGDRDLILRNYSTVLFLILRLRQLCNDVALYPFDIKSWLPANTLEGAYDTEEADV